MKHLRLQFGLKSLLYFVALCAVILTIAPLFITKTNHSASYMKGVADAQAQIRRGHITLIGYGSRAFDRNYDVSDYDPQLGLPIESAGCCCVEAADAERANGHNDYIKRWISAGNIPPNSLKKHNALIANPFATTRSFNFVGLSANSPIQLGRYQITYSIISGLQISGLSSYHKITVMSSSGTWAHGVFTDSRRFRASLIADGRILALRYYSNGQETYAGKLYETIELFDAETGISLNGDDRETRKIRQKVRTRNGPPARPAGELPKEPTHELTAGGGSSR